MSRVVRMHIAVFLVHRGVNLPYASDQLSAIATRSDRTGRGLGSFSGRVEKRSFRMGGTREAANESTSAK